MEKYQARPNGEEIPEKTEKELQEESTAKVAKTAVKGVASYFAPGVGGTVVDMISETKAGQQAFDRAGKLLSKTPGIGKISKDLDDQGLVDVADSAVDMLGNPAGGAASNATGAVKGASTANAVQGAGTASGAKATNASSALNKVSPEGNPMESSSKSDLLSSSADSSNSSGDSKSFLDNILGDGNFDLLKMIGKTKIIVSCGIFFFFVVLMTAIVSAKDFGNLDLTNKSEAMGGYVPESINVLTPGSISNINDEVLNGKTGSILNGDKSLSSILGEEGINLLNDSIVNSATMAGYGTGAAPAAAAQALLTNLLNNNIVIPYFWGGGHGAISTGVNGNWGSFQYVSAPNHFTSFSNQPLGLDCSGFVSWALYNGGCKNFTTITAVQFKDLGPGISFSEAKTGDIAASSSHVVLILENRGDSLLCAEAKGSNDGVVFSLRSSSNLANYKIVDMSTYYQQNCS